jgi:hypothetical protein
VYTPQGVGKLLRRLGLSSRRPPHRAWQADPWAVERWRQDECPEIARRARRAGAIIYFGDEASVRSDHHSGTTWGPWGSTPVVEATGAQFSVNMVSAVSAQGLLRFQIVDDPHGAECVPPPRRRDAVRSAFRLIVISTAATVRARGGKHARTGAEA